MSLFTKIADALIEHAKRTPYFHLTHADGRPYMNRFWLLPYSPWRPAARVHEIMTSDDDCAHHDHPWDYLSVILKGGYWEVRPVFKDGIYQGDTRKWHGPGSILFRRANSWHRLELDGGPATTLFITFKYRQRWGFMPQPERNKVYYQDYMGQQNRNVNDSTAALKEQQ